MKSRAGDFSLSHVAVFKSVFVIALIFTVTFNAVPNALALTPHVQYVAAFSQMDLYPNIETMGVVVNGTNLPATAELMMRPSGDPNWRRAHPFVRTDDGRLIGSLFGLSPSTTYEVRVTDGATEILNSTTTQPDQLSFTPTGILYVNASAQPGGDGSAAAPLQSIQEAVNRATTGTQVLVADGVYHEAISFPSSGSSGNWIQVKAQGNGAILDGSTDLKGATWEQYNDRKNIWLTKLSSPVVYVARDGKRFYNFDDLPGLTDGNGHNKIPMNEGWFVAPFSNKLYVRSDNPANHSWQVPVLNHAFDIDSRDWIWIEGFEIRYYGVGNSCGICATNASHLVIRKNKIHNVQLGVFTNWNGNDAQGNDTRIEFNEIYDPPVNEWPWTAVKATSMEGTGIVIRGHIGAIVRGNDIHNFFNGIYTGTSASSGVENPAIAFDADIYNNFIHQISDDALEPEGAIVNQRFRNNNVDSTFVGISLAPITQGPTWVLRNVFSNFTGKAIKWDLNTDGVVLIYHNTSWTNLSSANGMDLISPIRNTIMRNNIFSLNGGFSFQEVLKGSSGNNWDNNNWYTTRGVPHFLWESLLYNNTAGLCSGAGLECKGYEDAPGLANPSAGNFTLLPSSPNLDRGVSIPGINDNFGGSAPDVGAYELALDLAPKVVSVTRADANPASGTSVNFNVTFSEPVSGVDAADLVVHMEGGIAGAAINNITPVSATTYLVNVNTGAGNGLIRLDVSDDNSIVDAAANPLGGSGVGDGSFTSGEAYSIEKNLPIVASILRTDSTPTTADVIHFAVTFSKDVIGVDASDFTPTVTGNVSNVTVSAISGSGSLYNVAVNVGSGEGTVRLDLIDNDSIVDSTNNPLAGPGAGNGNFITGDAYQVSKGAPVVLSSTRVDADPTSADVISFKVIFSKPVSGVDAGDFVLTASGNVTSTSINVVPNSADIYTVVLGLGNGGGTLRLDVADNDSIVDSANQPLGGAGAGNGNFTAGETYTINKSTVKTYTETYFSSAAYDGWVLESGENSGKGGSKDASSKTFNLGDDSKNRQYKAILHFSTSPLPDNATITMVLLTVKKQGLVGTDPFTTHQNISIDIRNGVFGSFGPFSISSLEESDFQYPASLNSVGLIQNNSVSGWYWASLDPKAFPYINLFGSTQFRLGFQLDDNNDFGDDYIKFFSGNADNASDRPQLMIQYTLP